MASIGKPRSNQNQSTLFQTWGYSQLNGDGSSTASTATGGNKKQRTYSKIAINGFKNGERGSKDSEVIVDDDIDGLLEFFGDDGDKELPEVASTKARHTETYLDGNFNIAHSPEDLPGFDSSSGHNYIYPVNYPVREYQFRIIMKALTENTLVVLPTGLGKTFIAAVVMYNFYRWYPQGKIVFMAPTKPLVAQQIQACYDITGTPDSDTAEMTGSIAPTRRKVLWETKRIFFLTPHVLQNDLGRGVCFAKDIVCLVFDEAHKALGNYAYCQVVKEIYGVKSNFRVLALSATPGGDMTAVQQVVTNLMISHVELRSEDSPDIKPYVYGRDVEKIVVPLSEELKKAKQQFTQVLEGLIQRLCTQGVCWQQDVTKVSKFLLLKAREQFRARGMEDKTRAGVIEGDFALAISLYHAYELLQQHGILSFYNFLKEICSGAKGTARGRYELMRHDAFIEMMEDLRLRIEPPDDVDNSMNGSFVDVLTPKRRLLKSIPKPNSSFTSHPKLKKLEDVVVKHFEAAKENLGEVSSQTPLNTRIMIFSQYRDSVQEITAVLSKFQPLVKVMSFVGQNGSGKAKKGLSQKEQLEVVEQFRKGGYNVLVSTSVGEEGLDIGDVDLIICFDASNSPIRLVQRMGRTGRKRAGRIIILVTEGKEEQVYKRSLMNRKNIHKKLLDATNSLVLYDESPRMIPKHMNPYCLKMQIIVQPREPKSRGIKRKSSEDRPKKISRKKLDKVGDKEDNCARAEEKVKVPKEKKSRKKKIAEKKLDKVKAWRRSTLRMKTIDLTEDEDDDFQLERNDKRTDPDAVSSKDNREHHEAKSSLQIDGNDVENAEDDELYQEQLLSAGVAYKALDDTDDCIKDRNYEVDVEEIVLEKEENKPNSLITAATSSLEHLPSKAAESDEDIDFLCTQNIASLLPSSTPNRDFRALKSTSAALKRSLVTSEVITVPPPPKCGDLDDIAQDCNGLIDSSNDQIDLADKGSKRDDHHGSIISSNTDGNKGSNNEVSCPKFSEPSRNMNDGFEKSNYVTLMTTKAEDFSKISEVNHSGNEEINRIADLSNLDLFGDSLVDFEGDFEDCPSPSVVTQANVHGPEERKPIIKRDYFDERALLSKSIDSEDAKVVKREADSFLYEFDNMKDSSPAVQRDRKYKDKAVVAIDRDDDSKDINFDLFDCTAGTEEEVTILSLAARLKKRNSSEKGNSPKKDAECLHVIRESMKGCSTMMFSRQEIFDVAGSIKNDIPSCKSSNSTSKISKSNKRMDRGDPAFNDLNSPLTCHDKRSCDNANSSCSSDSDNDCPMPSLATRLRSRQMPSAKGTQRRAGSNLPNTVTNSKTSINTGHRDESMAAQYPAGIVDRANSEPEIEGDSPIVAKDRRRRKAIRRIMEDSQSPIKDDCNCVSGDDDFDKSILGRRKTKKYAVFKSPLLRHSERSSDGDFECATAANNVTRRNNKKSRFATKGNRRDAKKSCKVNFIDDEAALSGDDSGDEICTDVNEYVMDSFIDDATQRPQITPTKIDRDSREHVDMAMVYRQSLFSPMYGALNFRTPVYKANKNRYKMVERSAWHLPSEDDDEADEVNDFIEDDDEADEVHDLIEDDDEAEEVDSFIEDGGDCKEDEGDETQNKDVFSCDELENTKIQQVHLQKKSSRRVKRILVSDDDEGSQNETRRVENDANGRTTVIEDEKPGTPEPFDVEKHERSCLSSTSSKPSEDRMHLKSEDEFLGLNDDDFVPCFDLGFDLGIIDINTVKQALKSIKITRDDSSTLRRKCEELADADHLETVKTTNEKEDKYVFASTKIVASSQIGSILRLRHHVKLTVCSKLGCDFVVSKRMGIIRKVVSDISNGSNSAKILASISEMAEHYSRSCVIIEKDRLKGSSVAERHFSYSKYFTGLLAHLAECQIKTVFSDSQEDTASLIYRLADVESKTDFGLNATSMKLKSNGLEQMHIVLLTVPHISYPLSVRLCNEYRCLKPLINSSVEEIKAKIPEISTTQTKKIVKYFHHQVLTI